MANASSDFYGSDKLSTFSQVVIKPYFVIFHSRTLPVVQQIRWDGISSNLCSSLCQIFQFAILQYTQQPLVYVQVLCYNNIHEHVSVCDQFRPWFSVSSCVVLMSPIIIPYHMFLLYSTSGFYSL